MTVRDATTRESPDGHVLYIEELRRHLGVLTDAGEGYFSTNASKARPEFLLIGHDMHGDFQNMEKDGMELEKYVHYSGCVDTQGLAELELKKPQCPGKPAKIAYIGAHCAGNDAVATLAISIAQALDLSLSSLSHGDSVGEEDMPEDWLETPRHGMNTKMILLSYDTKGVETPYYKPKVLNRTIEHGFAWLRVADIAHTPPGQRGKNWRPFYHIRHWINQDFRNFKNRYFCVGNPMGFWAEYGKSQYYDVSEGPAPFHKLFAELANVTASAIEESDTVEEAASILERTTLGESTPAARGDTTNTRGKQPAFRGHANITRGNTIRENKVRGNTFRGNTFKGNTFKGNTFKGNTFKGNTFKGNTFRGNTNNVGGKQPAFRGNAKSIRGNTTNTRGKQFAFRGNENIVREDTATNRDNNLSWAQIAQANVDKEDE